MIHRYEGVCVAKVIGYVKADSQEEAREKLYQRDLGEIEDIYLQSVNLLDDLDPVYEEEETENGAIV